MSLFTSQADYVAYHSPEQRTIRTEKARQVTEQAVCEAHALFFAGDADAACQRLFEAGLTDEGIAHCLLYWGGDT